MKLSLALLLLGISLSQAFNPWGVFQKWKGEVEEALDHHKNKEHAERFLKEVKDRKDDLAKQHEELGRDVMNKVHKVYEKIKDIEIIPTEPYEPEILPEKGTEGPESTGIPQEIEPTGESEVVKPTEEFVEPTEENIEPIVEEVVEPTDDDFVEPTEEHVEPTENFVEPNEIDVLSAPDAPVVPPTDEPEVEPTEQPTEDLELIEEPIEGNHSSDEDREEDFFLEKDNDDDEDKESSEEEELPEEPQPVEEELEPEVNLSKNVDEIEVEDVDFAPKELWKEIHEKSFGMKWLKKRQHKLKKLWRKFAQKHSEKVFKKIRKLEKRIGQMREE